MSVAGRLVVIAGATSASGLAAARELIAAGARVVAVGRHPEKLQHLVDSIGTDAAPPGPSEAGSLRTEECDLADEAAVAALADRIHTTDGAVDGLLHLVGGWRGGGGLAGQTDADYRFLEGSFTSFRHVSRAFDGDLRSSAAGRIGVVSSTAVARPLAGGANYAAVKAATEAWARAVAQGFAKAARDAGEPLRAASIIFRVKALDGLEERLADEFVASFTQDAAALNDTVIDLSA
jgi:NAD(P)-dependent dehydrogenase (short-subunit alcohol dehydrogenase family)